MTITGSDEPALVRVELVHDLGESPGAPPAPTGGRKRLGAVAAAAVALVLLGSLWSLVRPEAGQDAADDPIVATTTTTTIATTTAVPTTSEPPPEAQSVAELDGPVMQVVRSNGVTLLSHIGPPFGSARIMRTTDGFDFQDVADPFGSQRLLSIAGTPTGFSALAVSPTPIPPTAPRTPESGSVSTYESPDGLQWTRTSTFEVGGALLGTIDPERWAVFHPVGVDAPDPEVSAMLAELVEPDIANETCQIINVSAVTEDQRFDLYDCTGALVGDVWVSSQQAAPMWIAAQILNGPFGVVSASDGDPQTAILPRGRYTIAGVSTEAGTYVLLVELYSSLSEQETDFDNLEFSLIRVDASGEIGEIRLPVVSGSAGDIDLRRHGDEISLIWGSDLYLRSIDGTSDWRAIEAGDGQRVRPTHDGAGVVRIDDIRREVWVLDDDGGWARLDTDVRSIESVPYVDGDHAVVVTGRGELVRVPLLTEFAPTVVRRPLGSEAGLEVLVTTSGNGEDFVGLARTETGIGLLEDPMGNAEAIATDLDPSFPARELRGDDQGLIVWGGAPDAGRFDVVLTSTSGRNWDVLELDLPRGIERFVIDDVRRSSTSMALLATAGRAGATDEQLLLWQAGIGDRPTLVGERPCSDERTCVITSVLALPDGILALHSSGGAWVQASVWRPTEGWSALPTEASWAEGVDVLPRSSAELRPRQPGRRDPRGGAERPIVLTDEWVGLLSVETGMIEKLWDAPVPGGRFDGVATVGLNAAYMRPDSVHVFSDLSLEWTRYAVTGLVLDRLMAVTPQGAMYLARGPDGPELVLFPTGPGFFDP